jgi:hypothetical protein
MAVLQACLPGSTAGPVAYPAGMVSTLTLEIRFDIRSSERAYYEALSAVCCMYPPAGLAAAGTCSTGSAWRSFAVDSKHRSMDDMHKYLDSLFCLKDKVVLVTGTY